MIACILYVLLHQSKPKRPHTVYRAFAVHRKANKRPIGRHRRSSRSAERLLPFSLPGGGGKGDACWAEGAERLSETGGEDGIGTPGLGTLSACERGVGEGYGPRHRWDGHRFRPLLLWCNCPPNKKSTYTTSQPARYKSCKNNSSYRLMAPS